MSHEHEEAAGADGVDATTLSAVGGAVGTALGARRGVAGAVAGGVVGGTLGYLAGATLQAPSGPAASTDTEPVSIDVSDPGEGETAAAEDADDSEE